MNKQSIFKSISFSWKYTEHHRKLLVFAVISQFISVALGVVAPIVSARIITAYANDEAWRVMNIALALLIIKLFQNFSS